MFTYMYAWDRPSIHMLVANMVVAKEDREEGSDERQKEEILLQMSKLHKLIMKQW
jgi:hypothetical protein